MNKTKNRIKKDELSAIIDLIDDAVFLINAEGNTVYANAKAEQLLGLPGGRNVVSFLKDNFLIHEESGADSFFRNILSGNAAESQAVFYDKDEDDSRAKNIYKVTVKSFNSEEGTYLLTVRDNTAELGLVNDLQNAANELQTLVDCNFETHFLMDLEGKVLQAGNATAARLKTELHHLLGKNIFDLIPPKIAVERKEYMKKTALEKRPVEFYDIRQGIYFHNIMYPVFGPDGSVNKVAVFAYDYTQRHKQEAVINENRELLNRSESIAKIGTWKLNLKNLRISYSKGFANIMEYPKEERDFSLKKLVDETTHDESSDDLNKTIKAVIENPHEARELEHKVVASSGKVKIVYTKGEPVYDDNGDLKYYQGVTHDITDRKEVEAELRVNKERFDAVISNLPVFFFSTDKGGVITLSEGKGLELLNTKPGEEVGLSLYDRYGRFPQVREVIDQVLKGKEWRGIFRFHKSIFDLNLKPIFDDENKLNGIVGVGLDITEKFKAEKDFTQLVELSLQGIVVIKDVKIPFANPAFSSMIGYSAEELKALEPGEVRELIYKEDREKAFKTIQGVLKGRIEGERLITRIVRKDGGLLWVDVSVSKIIYKGGPALQAFFVDFTDKLKAEQALLESEANLRALLNSTLQSFVYIGTDTIIKSFNNIAQETNKKVLGREIKTGDSIYDYIKSDGRRNFEEHFKRALNGEFVEANRQLVDKDGNTVYFKVNLNPVYDNNDTTIGVNLNTIDITELETAKAYLEENEKRYRGLVESQTDLVIRADKEGSLTFVNEAYKRKFGSAGEKIIGKKFTPLVQKKESTIAGHILKRLENPPYRFTLEHRALSSDGWSWISWECYGIHAKGGDVDEIQAVGRDVTDRKVTEEALRISEEKQRSILNSMDDLVFAIDSRGKFIEYYQSMNTQFYVSPSEFVGKHYTEILPEDVSEKLTGAIERIILTNATQQFEYEMPINGVMNYFSAKTSQRSNVDGTHAGVTMVIRNITKLTKSIKQLEESEEKFRQLAENINDVFWIRENDRILYVSPAYEKIWGSKREALYKDGNEFIEGIHKEDRDRVIEAMRNDNFTKLGKFDQEYRVVNKNGEVRWLWARTYPVHVDGESMKRTVGVAEDITLRKKAEEEIHLALEKATELSELKSRFISMVSHEFRTPLSTISLSSELLEAFGDSEPPEERKKHFKSIEKSIDYLTELLDDVITINRADAGRLSSKIEEVDIINYCRTLVEETMQSFQTHPNIMFDSSKETYNITTDVKLIRHIITNLVSNAIKYTPDEKNVLVFVNIRNTSFEIKVKDEGIGIPFRDQKELFQPFFRAKNTSNIPGSGLGLAITRRFVELIGGDITFNSKVGVGSEFTVIVPMNIDGDE